MSMLTTLALSVAFAGPPAPATLRELDPGIAYQQALKATITTPGPGTFDEAAGLALALAAADVPVVDGIPTGVRAAFHAGDTVLAMEGARTASSAVDWINPTRKHMDGLFTLPVAQEPGGAMTAMATIQALGRRLAGVPAGGSVDGSPASMWRTDALRAGDLIGLSGGNYAYAASLWRAEDLLDRCDASHGDRRSELYASLELARANVPTRDGKPVPEAKRRLDRAYAAAYACDLEQIPTVDVRDTARRLLVDAARGMSALEAKADPELVRWADVAFEQLHAHAVGAEDVDLALSNVQAMLGTPWTRTNWTDRAGDALDRAVEVRNLALAQSDAGRDGRSPEEWAATLRDVDVAADTAFVQTGCEKVVDGSPLRETCVAITTQYESLLAARGDLDRAVLARETLASWEHATPPAPAPQAPEVSPLPVPRPTLVASLRDDVRVAAETAMGRRPSWYLELVEDARLTIGTDTARAAERRPQDRTGFAPGAGAWPRLLGDGTVTPVEPVGSRFLARYWTLRRIHDLLRALGRRASLPGTLGDDARAAYAQALAWAGLAHTAAGDPGGADFLLAQAAELDGAILEVPLPGLDENVSQLRDRLAADATPEVRFVVLSVPRSVHSLGVGGAEARPELARRADADLAGTRPWFDLLPGADGQVVAWIPVCTKATVRVDGKPITLPTEGAVVGRLVSVPGAWAFEVMPRPPAVRPR